MLSLPGPLWLRMIVPHKVIPMGEIERFDNFKLYVNM